MIEASFEQGRGRSAAVSGAYQYDTGQRIRMHGLPGPEELARREIAVRAGLHCAPLAHESAGTLETGTVRVSFGHDASPRQLRMLAEAASKLPPR